MDQVADVLVPKVTSEVPVNIAGVAFSAQAWQVGAIIFLLFLLIVTIASMRHHFLEWTVKGAGFGVVLGFILALVLEGFLLLGGRTALTEIFAWQNAPRPIAGILDNSRQQFREVLGQSVEIPESKASSEKTTIDSALDKYRELTPTEANTFIEMICAPKPR